MTRRLLFLPAALLFGVLVALALGEVVIRAFRLEGDQFFEPNAWVGWVHRPGVHGTYVSDQAKNGAVQINRRGLLGPERPYDKPAGVHRVLLLGDSYTESMQVPYAQTWGALLEKSLGAGWEVINGGVAGYGTDNSLLELKREYAKYRPDVVFLLFFTGNDVSDNDFELYGPDRGSRPKPWYSLDSTGGLVLHDSPMPLPRSARARLKSALRTRSHLYRFVKDRLTMVRTARGYKKGSKSGVPRPWYVYSKAPAPDFDRAWRTTAALLHALRAETDSTGAFLAAGTLPTDWRIEPDQRRQVLSAYPAMADTSQWDFALADRKAAAIFAAEGIPSVDLTPSLEDARRAANVPLYGDHLTAAGHRVVAERLAQFFRDVVIPRVTAPPQ
ncbi:MAG: GDSL-type esterase/lipase family protein [bacterium]